MNEEEKKTDVHTEHCCKNCGCKYGEDQPDEEGYIDCSVVSGRKNQSLKCGHAYTCGWLSEIQDHR